MNSTLSSGFLRLSGSRQSMFSVKTDYKDLDMILALCKNIYREPKSFNKTILKAVTSLWVCPTVDF